MLCPCVCPRCDVLSRLYGRWSFTVDQRTCWLRTALRGDLFVHARERIRLALLTTLRGHTHLLVQADLPELEVAQIDPPWIVLRRRLETAPEVDAGFRFTWQVGS